MQAVHAAGLGSPVRAEAGGSGLPPRPPTPSCGRRSSGPRVAERKAGGQLRPSPRAQPRRSSTRAGSGVREVLVACLDNVSPLRGQGLRTGSRTHRSHREIRTRDQAASLLALQKLVLTHLRVCREPGVSGQAGLRLLPRSRRPRSPLEWQQHELELPKGCTDRRSSFQNIEGDERSPSGSGPASLLFPVSPPPRSHVAAPARSPHAHNRGSHRAHLTARDTEGQVLPPCLEKGVRDGPEWGAAESHECLARNHHI